MTTVSSPRSLFAEISCGPAEIFKMVLLRDPLLLEMLERDGPKLLASHFAAPSLVAREVLLRAELLMMEELTPNLFEGTLSRYVDFGHTFSPAIETGSDCRIPHGRAVAIDMLISTALAIVLDRAVPSLLDRLINLLAKLGIPAWDELVPTSRVLCAGLKDIELHRGGSLNLVVVTEPGKAVFLQTPTASQLDAPMRLLRSSVESSGCVIPRPNQQVYAGISL
jgi:3-dehydroquinate synthase